MSLHRKFRKLRSFFLEQSQEITHSSFFNWIVSVGREKNGNFEREMGGVLVGDQYIATSPHGPFSAKKLYYAEFPSANGMAKLVLEARPFKNPSKDLDIGLMKLKGRPSGRIPIGIPNSELGALLRVAGHTGWALGLDLWRREWREASFKITDEDTGSGSSFCAVSEKTSVCHGDSGGPFVMKYDKDWCLVGLIESFKEAHCSADPSPGIFACADHYLSAFESIKAKILKPK